MPDLHGVREILLYLITATFAFFAVFSLARPRILSGIIGLELTSANAWSEFYAIYFGVFSAQAALAWFAIERIEDTSVSALVALFSPSPPDV